MTIYFVTSLATKRNADILEIHNVIFLREGFLFDASSCLLFLFSLTRRRLKVMKKSEIEAIQMECNAVDSKRC